MLRHGATCSPEEFHAAVNVTFHQFESSDYDRLHADMWESLPRQVGLLAQDALKGDVPVRLPEKIRLLDIGCGTGLATELLLRTPLGARVTDIDLIDTSANMLARAQERRKGWDRPGDTMEGVVESLIGKKTYDLIITCSVLHHVPNLTSFLGAVTQLQPQAGSVFLHLQDPNGDYHRDAEKAHRAALVESDVPEWLARLKPSRVLGRLVREIRGDQGKDYISRTNHELMRQGFVSSPLAVSEIFAITDIHVHNGGGVSIAGMKELLPCHELVQRRSYAFYGVLESVLPEHLRANEDRWIREGAPNGEYVEAVWRRLPA